MKKLLSLFLTIITCQLLYAQNIYTLAGGIRIRSGIGDGELCIDAAINSPMGLVTDTAGNLFIVDMASYRIRKIDANCTITTLAGTGGSGSVGPVHTKNNVLATTSPIHTRQITVDRAGNIYFIDWDMPVIRKISTSGILSVFAGDTSAIGYSGDGGPAILALLNHPESICVDDSGNLYIADDGVNVIRKVNTLGIISTFAGNGTAGYTGDGGVATSAAIGALTSVAVDHNGYLYFAQTYGSVIRKISLSTNIISTFAGNGIGGDTGDGGLALSAEISSPYYIVFDKFGNCYLSALSGTAENRLRKIDNTGIITTFAGNDTEAYKGDGGPAIDAELFLPQGVAVDPSGEVVYIADMSNNRVRMVLACTSDIKSQPRDTTVAVGEKPTFTLDVSGAGAYQWQVDTGAGFKDIDTTIFDYFYYRNVHNRILQVPAAAPHMNNFKYRCIRYSLTACPDTSVAATLHVIPLAVPTFSGNGSIEISPNPASNQLSIVSPENINSLQVTDITGKLLIDKQTKGQKQVLDISTLPPGMYMLRLNNLYIQKFVKE